VTFFGDLLKEDPEICSPICLRNQRAVDMENDELKRKIDRMEEIL